MFWNIHQKTSPVSILGYAEPWRAKLENPEKWGNHQSKSREKLMPQLSYLASLRQPTTDQNHAKVGPRRKKKKNFSLSFFSPSFLKLRAAGSHDLWLGRIEESRLKRYANIRRNMFLYIFRLLTQYVWRDTHTKKWCSILKSMFLQLNCVSFPFSLLSAECHRPN